MEIKYYDERYYLDENRNKVFASVTKNLGRRNGKNEKNLCIFNMRL